MIELICFHCNKANTVTAKISFREECLHCRSDLHVCKNCDFYDVKSYNECREPSAEVVRDKEKGNYCDFFTVRKGGSGPMDEKARLKAAAEALFKK
ncbi:hypothetical protein [Pseudobdellovibrio exovorus]|uniref:Uncharacterized protein n=1 Tax=Pseudobdellovibrio exovorus JSS TaxID=1184267 RepID=M4VR03_9BACT|nr:hypothetical protein [Pseudobdellovibrio exovorus]AGH95594.1 hypothetical protein A11Q_1378 [Pseudobdellovibrio exovorus JSS]